MNECLSVFKCAIIYYISYNIVCKPQKHLKFFSVFGVCNFSVSTYFNLADLILFLRKRSLKRRLYLENKHFVRFNVIPLESNRNKILSENWLKNHLQYLQLSLLFSLGFRFLCHVFEYVLNF